MLTTATLAAGLLVIFPAILQAQVTETTNQVNGLRSWHFVQGDVEIKLTQRLPDQTRAMFMTHGFSRDAIEKLALSCMFQTIIRNTNASGKDHTVSLDLTTWRTQYNGEQYGIVLKEPLLESWTKQDADLDARLVVRWAMFPTWQDYLPSDYNWGLTAYGIPPGEQFDLNVAWQENGKKNQGYIPGMVCAPDVERLK